MGEGGITLNLSSSTQVSVDRLPDFEDSRVNGKGLIGSPLDGVGRAGRTSPSCSSTWVSGLALRFSVTNGEISGLLSPPMLWWV